MTPDLLSYLCEPITKSPLQLVDAVLDENGDISEGVLVAPSGKTYHIIDGIPRFMDFVSTKTVQSFGDEWNYFNFVDFKVNWLSHTVANTFGTTDAFRDKVIVDAGGGSGAQARWFAEYGARHVIMLDLSHAVDDVVRRNLSDIRNVDVVQCSIDAPPLKEDSIDGIVYCHNVIQHTPSVKKTARALYAVVAPGGEFVFNCYPLNDKGLLRWTRFHMIYKPLRGVLSRMPFRVIMMYAWLMAILRLIPWFGMLLEKCGLCLQGDVPRMAKESGIVRLRRRFKATSLNTFDWYGGQKYQHHKADDEIRELVQELQPDLSKTLNREQYFQRPKPIGVCLRVFK